MVDHNTFQYFLYCFICFPDEKPQTSKFVLPKERSCHLNAVSIVKKAKKTGNVGNFIMLNGALGHFCVHIAI